MDVLIIGNGFDIAHGLKTKYVDFLNYCKNKEDLQKLYPNNEIKLNLWLKHFLFKLDTPNNTQEHWIDLEEEIFQVIKMINKNLKEENLKFFGNITGLKLAFDNAFNFEKFFSNVRVLNNIKEYTKKNHSEQHLELLVENVKYLSDFLYEQLRDFTKLFKNYLQSEIINNITDDMLLKSPYRLSNVGNKVYILNFNYTNIFEKYYQYGCNTIFERSDTLKIKTFYIHGTFQNNPINLVLGTDSFDDNDIDINFYKFKKYNQRHKYKTIENYQNLIDILLKLPENMPVIFHIIGHSLGRSDHKILKHILQIRNSKIKIYYYNETNQQENLINNIKEIIGEEDVMTRVQFINQHDCADGILIPKENS